MKYDSVSIVIHIFRIFFFFFFLVVDCYVDIQLCKDFKSLNGNLTFDRRKEFFEVEMK